MYSEVATRRRIICAHDSFERRPVRTRIISKVRRDSPIYSRKELDLHADTVVLGRSCIILTYTGRECDVSPYSETYEFIKGAPIVMCPTREVTLCFFISVFPQVGR